MVMTKTLLYTLLIFSLFSQLSMAQSKNEQIEKLLIVLDSSKYQQLKLTYQIIELNKTIQSSQENHLREISKCEFSLTKLESKTIRLQYELDSLKGLEKYSLNENSDSVKSNRPFLLGLKLASIDSTDLAIEELTNVVKKHNGTSDGEIAQFVLGRQYMDKGEFTKALIELEDVHIYDAEISSMCLGLQGDCQSQMKDYKKAFEKYLEAALKYENDLTTPRYMFKAALCAEKVKDFDTALVYYSKIKDNYTAFANQKGIDNYIARALKSKN
jgi:tetratricopeptide (TPR) repeat protein